MYLNWSRVTGLAATFLSVVLLVLPAEVLGAETRRVGCQQLVGGGKNKSITLGKDLLTGDIIFSGDLAVQVPERNQFISIHSSRPPEYSALPDMLGVTVTEAGQIQVRGCVPSLPEIEELGEMTLASPIPECSNTLYTLTGDGKWSSRMDWYFKKDSSPSELNVTNVETALRNATNAIQFANNSCGRPDNVGATALYQGNTSAWANISFAGGQYVCTQQSNGLSTVDFAGGPQGSVAAACTRGNGTTITESDIRFNKGSHSWTPWPGAGCSGRYSVRAVGTHERGHSFGLGHVGGFHNSLMTMFTNSFLCHDGAYTLGLGDMLGLEYLY